MRNVVIGVVTAVAGVACVGFGGWIGSMLHSSWQGVAAGMAMVAFIGYVVADPGKAGDL